MAGKTSIANPVVVLGLDAGPFTAGLEKAKVAGTAASKKMSEAAKGGPKPSTPSLARAAPRAAGGGGGVSAGDGIGAAARLPLMPIIALNQAMEFAAKITKTIGAPMRALMGREQLQAQFSGIGTIDPMGGTFTAGIARFGATFETMLADIAESLDRTFDLKGKLEYARGALSGISALLTAFFGNLEPIVKDPEALTKQFKAGALMVVNVFEYAATESKKIYDNVVSALDSFGINIKLINDVFSGVITALKALNPNTKKDPKELQGGLQDAGARLGARMWGIALTMAGVSYKNAFALLDNVKQDQQRNIDLWNKGGGGDGLPMPNAGAPMAIGQGPNIAGIAQQARNNINAMGLMAPADAEKLLMQRAGVIMGKIGGDLGTQIATKIAPLMASGSAQLEDALVKAQLQGEAGDIQKRIEGAIQKQLKEQEQQTKTLNRIKQIIAGANNPLAVLGDNN